MGVFEEKVPFKGQKYHDLKAKCIKKGQLFEDPTFPPNSTSLSYRRSAPTDIQWKRPKDIVANPKFLDDGVSADDFSQGSLGNCWFVAACACLAEDSKLWKKVVPDHEEQDWSPSKKYAGIFHFKFWRCGEWTDVVIDDYLPTRNGRLIYVHSKSGNEFWSALLEKAYAKLAGDYESLTSGNAKDALVDMTGGVGERISLDDYKTEAQNKELFRILKLSKENHSLMTASIAATGNEIETELRCGLVKGHAYSITAVKKIKLGTGLLAIFKRDYLQMVRCRNPWGGKEWKGAWSDGSSEWKNVSAREKKDMGLTFDENGEFWMSYEDFCHYFTSMDICHMFNQSVFTFKKTWKEDKILGAWRLPDRCGGCGNHQTFLKNPQYLFDIQVDSDEVMVSLEQKDKRVEKGKDNYTIGITILKACVNRKYRMHDKLQHVASGPFVLSRSIFTRVQLKRGRYCIIPSTFEPGQVGNFVMRVYATYNLNLIELLYDEPMPRLCCGFTKRRSKVAVTQITLVKAENLAAKDQEQSISPYCVVKYEGRQIQNYWLDNTLNPEWNDRVTLYRKKPHEDIIIEVWNHNVLKDQLIGFVTVSMEKPQNYSNRNIIKRYSLFVKEKKTLVPKPGGLWLKVIHTDEMALV